MRCGHGQEEVEVICRSESDAGSIAVCVSSVGGEARKHHEHELHRPWGPGDHCARADWRIFRALTKPLCTKRGSSSSLYGRLTLRFVFSVQRGVRGSGISVDPERVRQARVVAGLTLAQLAGKEVSRTFIHQVERGLARPSPPVLRLIARRTGKPLSYFLQPAAGALTGKDLSTELSAAATRLRRFIAINKLSPTEREAMKLVEMSLRQGATLARGIQTKAPQ